MKNILLLFIASLICIVYSINHLSYKHIDTKADMYFAGMTFHTSNPEVINQIIKSPKTTVINENARLIITLSVTFVALIVLLALSSGLKYLFLAFFIIAYFTAYKLLINNFIFINLYSPILALLAAPFFVKTYKQVFLTQEEKRLEKLLGKYISKDIKNEILKNIDNVDLGGKKAEISIMFADIRGFTSFSESTSAEEVSKLLNEYFTEIEPIITKYKGVINKFIGDAVLVIFGEPVQDKQHARNAVLCADELNKKVKKLQQRWIKEGKPKIDIGIAINTGEAFVGNVGTSDRFEYTVLGDAVNIASRIEDYNKIYKTHILISQNTYQKISQLVDVIKIREVSIKGKANKINIYEVLRIIDDGAN